MYQQPNTVDMTPCKEDYGRLLILAGALGFGVDSITSIILPIGCAPDSYLATNSGIDIPFFFSCRMVVFLGIIKVTKF